MLDDAREKTVSQTGNGEPATKEAEALASALNHSAERVQTLWFSFLTFMLYLAIATGTTTHRMLFLESPLNLPVLNIPLPLLGFYILTPVIFVVLHFYMLLNLVLLARTARSFEDALVLAFPEDGAAREDFRMRIENTLFVQLLVGGRLEREGINAKLLSAMALITLALFPVLLLLMFEIMFLPYHSWQITWLHRGLLTLDLALVWILWPGYRSGWGVVRLWPKGNWRLAWPAVAVPVLAYAVVVATFPDERMYLATHWLHGSINLDPVTGEVSFSERPNWYAWITWPNTLDLHGEDLIDDAKLARIVEKNESSTDLQRWEAPRWIATLSLAGRDLTGANLREADVRHVDFSYAILNRADLSYAWAEKAHFDNSQLQGAALDNAQLRGAVLMDTQLHGASLMDAQLQGATLDDAQLRGASLERTQLQGAALMDAQLQGASLHDTQLQGASLERTKLQGASLDGAQLQGALLGGAELEGASFVGACLWRVDARQAVWRDTRVARPETSAKADNIHECGLPASFLSALKQLIAAEVPEGYNRLAVMERIERLDPTKALEGEDEMAKVWAARESEAPTPEAYEKSLAGQWHKTGCAVEGAPYVLHGLLAQLSDPLPPRFAAQSDAAKALASDFLDEEHCPGAHALSDDDKAELKKIATPVVPQAPKP